MSKRYKALVNGTEFDLETDTAKAEKGRVGEQDYLIDIQKLGDGKYHVLHNHASCNVEVIESSISDKKVTVRINGVSHEVQLKDENDLLLETLGISGVGSDSIDALKAPMPGMVLDIMVEEGQQIGKGEPLIVLEAMKMENILKAPEDVVISNVPAKKGQAVEKNEVLIKFQ